MKKLLLFLLCFNILIPLQAFAQADVFGNSELSVANSYFEKARIINLDEITETITDDIEDSAGYKVVAIQKVKVEVLSGNSKGKIFEFENNVSNNPLNIKLKEGDLIVLNIEEYENGTSTLSISDHYRLNYIILLVAIFAIALILFGGFKGIKTVISLVMSILLIFMYFIPKILEGESPVKLAIYISIVITFVSILLIGGRTKKSASAIIGTLSGVLVALLLSVIFSKLAHLSGLSTEESRLFAVSHQNINVKGIFFAGIIIGSLGAVMDISMSIASTINEIKRQYEGVKFSDLVASGINVGRDIMGTMANTLIFAYVSVSLPILLLYSEFGQSYFKFLNFDFVGDEIIRSIGGSIGMLAAIPVTAFISGLLEVEKRKKSKKTKKNQGQFEFE